MLRALIFMHEWLNLQLKFTFERQIFFKQLSMEVLFILRIFSRNPLRASRRKNIFHIFLLKSDLRFKAIPHVLTWLPDFYWYYHSIILIQKGIFNRDL